MPRDYQVFIAGRKYPLRYRLDARDEIEQRASNGEPRALMQIMVSGSVRDQATVVWGGVKGAKPDVKITPRGLIEEFQRHNDKGGDYYQDVVCQAYIAAAESKLLGDVDLAEFKRIIGFKEPEGKDEGGPPAAVRAAE
jgi:hypothetical protein